MGEYAGAVAVAEVVAGWTASCSGWGSGSGSESAAAVAGVEVRGGTSSGEEALVILKMSELGEWDECIKRRV